MSSLLKLYFTNWEIKPHSQSWLAVTWDNTLLEPDHTPHSLISDPDHVCVATCTPHVPALLSSVFLHIRVLLSGMHFRPLGHSFVLHCHPSVSLALEFSSLGQALFGSTHTASLFMLVAPRPGDSQLLEDCILLTSAFSCLGQDLACRRHSVLVCRNQ